MPWRTATMVSERARFVLEAERSFLSFSELCRTLKADTASPPRTNLRAQQRPFDQFRFVDNHERPHEALGQETPASIYRNSKRRYSKKPDSFAYPGHFEVRLVAQDSTIGTTRRSSSATSSRGKKSASRK